MLAQGLALAAHAQLQLPRLQALVADEGLGTRKELLHLVGFLAAERALLLALVFVHAAPPVPRPAGFGFAKVALRSCFVLTLLPILPRHCGASLRKVALRSCFVLITPLLGML